MHLVINVFHDITDERSAEARIRFLAEASALLSTSLDYEATLADLGRLLVRGSRTTASWTRSARTKRACGRW